MKTSPAGRAAITQREGRRLTAYRDTRGIWTIGVGHAATGLPPKPHAGMTITAAECDALLAADLAPVEAAINKIVTVRISQNQFDAMASLAFNIGVGGFERSSVVRDLNAGHYRAAANAFLMWDHPEVLAGRRMAERKQFLTPDPATDAEAEQPAAPVVEGVASPELPAAAKPAASGLFSGLAAALGLD